MFKERKVRIESICCKRYEISQLGERERERERERVIKACLRHVVVNA